MSAFLSFSLGFNTEMYSDMFPVRRLIMFAGVPCSGKTTVIEALQKGALSALASRLRMGDPADWIFLSGRRVQRMPDDPVENLFLHYDILRQWKEAEAAGYDEDAPLAVLDYATELTIVTLWTAPDELLRRARSRRTLWMELVESIMRKPSRRTRMVASLCQLYASPNELMQRYRRWFSFCRSHPCAGHWVLDTTPWPPVVSSLDEWASNAGRPVLAGDVNQSV